jgi:hypothetical protein
LPEEDYEEGICGMLLKAMYGTRDAAQNWEVAYIEFMESAGFVKGVASPCVFYNSQKNIRTVIHGDDFTMLGNEEDLDWFRNKINERFEVKVRGRLGPSEKDDKSIRILNRVVEWTSSGISYEADQRHAEIIVKQLGLEKESRSLSTPGVKQEEKKGETEGCERELNGSQSTLYRALVARGIYLSQDRSDIGYSIKELSRKMSKPDTGDIEKLKHLARYLLGIERAVIHYDYQSMPSEWTVWVDSDWAGCRVTRKSTSGGLVMWGSHVIRTWSTTQSVIAMSSGEAEYYSMVKGSSMGMGIKSIAMDLGVVMSVINAKTDASAAKGIASRKGLGKIGHIEVSQLWLQRLGPKKMWQMR